VNYVLKYPSHVEKLILVSPVGVPKSPYEDGRDTISLEPSESSTSSPINEKLNVKSEQSSIASSPPRRIPPWVKLLWEAKISPFTVIRLPVLGPKLASGWTSRRFSHLPTISERQILPRYAYRIFRLRGSGEFALTYILSPGAYAKRPLVNRVQGLGQDGVLKKVVWVYGDSDWMDIEGAREASEKMEIASRIFVVEGSGHNVHLDNPEGLNEIVIGEF
jgi:cardiolipin-specific phospholipase